jgi:YesN/AraC family two-component response regulator
LAFGLIRSQIKLRSKFGIVISYIEKNYSKKIYLQDLADLLHYETSYFSKLFKKVLGVSFSEYIQDVRLKNAEKLLEETDYSVEELSSMVGYQDKKQLYKLFRERSNITPGAFRRNGK